MTTEAAPAQAAAQDQGKQPQAQTQAPAKAGLMDVGGAGDQPGTGTAGEPGKQGHNSGGQFDANGDWRSGFSEGLDEPTRNSWGKLASRYTTPAEMAKAHVNLVQTMDKRIAVPGENAKPEEWDGVWNKLGRPETADKYTFEFPADAPWDDAQKEQVKGLAPLFHKNGATQKQVNEYVRQQAELDKVARDAAIAKANTLAQQRQRQLQTEWRGEDFQRNRSMAATTVKTYAGGDTDEMASMRLDDGTFVLDHPVFARMFAKIGSERAEDDRDPTAFNAGNRETVKSQIEAIEAEAKEKGITPSNRMYPHAKLELLYAKLHGKRNDFGARAGR